MYKLGIKASLIFHIKYLLTDDITIENKRESTKIGIIALNSICFVNFDRFSESHMNTKSLSKTLICSTI